MASIHAKLKSSPSLEKGGTWMETGNTRVLLARAGGSNSQFLAAFTKVFKEHKRALDLDLVSDEKSAKLFHEIYAEHIVLDWETNLNDEKTDDFGKPLPANWVKGIENPNGDGLLPVTFDNVVMTFQMLPDFFGMCKEHAETAQFYTQALADQIAKNLKRSSITSEN